MSLMDYHNTVLKTIERLERIYKSTDYFLTCEDFTELDARGIVEKVENAAQDFYDDVLQLKRAVNPVQHVYICPECNKPVEEKLYILLGTERYHIECYQKVLADNREYTELWARVLALEREMEAMRKERLKQILDNVDTHKDGECKDGMCKVL